MPMNTGIDIGAALNASRSNRKPTDTPTVEASPVVEVQPSAAEVAATVETLEATTADVAPDATPEFVVKLDEKTLNENPFAEIFILDSFRIPKKGERVARQNGGGADTNLADVVIRMGHRDKSGKLHKYGYMLGARIVLRENGSGVKQIEASWPSTVMTRYQGGIFQFDADSAIVRRQFVQYGQALISAYVPWRQHQVKVGNVQAGMVDGKAANIMTAEQLAALGL